MYKVKAIWCWVRFGVQAMFLHRRFKSGGYLTAEELFILTAFNFFGDVMLSNTYPADPTLAEKFANAFNDNAAVISKEFLNPAPVKIYLNIINSEVKLLAEQYLNNGMSAEELTRRIDLIFRLDTNVKLFKSVGVSDGCIYALYQQTTTIMYYASYSKNMLWVVDYIAGILKGITVYKAANTVSIPA